MEKTILLATVIALRNVIIYRPETQTKRVKLTRQRLKVNSSTNKKAVEFCLPYICVPSKCFPTEKLRACPMKRGYIIFGHHAICGGS